MFSKSVGVFRDSQGPFVGCGRNSFRGFRHGWMRGIGGAGRDLAVQCRDEFQGWRRNVGEILQGHVARNSHCFRRKGVQVVTQRCRPAC